MHKDLSTLIKESRNSGKITLELQERVHELTDQYIDRPSFKRLPFLEDIKTAVVRDLLSVVLEIQDNHFAQCIHEIRTAAFREMFLHRG